MGVEDEQKHCNRHGEEGPRVLQGHVLRPPENPELERGWTDQGQECLWSEYLVSSGPDGLADLDSASVDP